MIVKTFETWTIAVVSLKYYQVNERPKKERKPKVAESDYRFLR